jgi:hypothetical protein
MGGDVAGAVGQLTQQDPHGRAAHLLDVLVDGGQVEDAGGGQLDA